MGEGQDSIEDTTYIQDTEKAVTTTEEEWTTSKESLEEATKKLEEATATGDKEMTDYWREQVEKRA